MVLNDDDEDDDNKVWKKSKKAVQQANALVQKHKKKQEEEEAKKKKQLAREQQKAAINAQKKMKKEEKGWTENVKREAVQKQEQHDEKEIDDMTVPPLEQLFPGGEEKDTAVESDADQDDAPVSALVSHSASASGGGDLVDQVMKGLAQKMRRWDPSPAKLREDMEAKQAKEEHEAQQAKQAEDEAKRAKEEHEAKQVKDFEANMDEAKQQIIWGQETT